MLSSAPSKWDRFWNTNRSSRFTKISWSKRRIIFILNRYVRKGIDVLDAGCGSGFFSAFFISCGCNTFCLDYSKTALEIAREHTKNSAKKYILGDLLDDNLVKAYTNRFDLIFTDGLFEHFSVSEQDRISNNFKLMKKKGGKIITFVPNRFTLWTLIRPFYLPGIKEKPFTIERLKKLHRKNGFEIDEWGGINVIPAKYSPDMLIGKHMGMLIYCVGH